jgi:uncharacterized protein (TIGR02271 family)
MAELVDVWAGMRVVSSDGEDLGSLARVEGDHLVVRSGFLFRREDAIAVRDVADVEDGEVRLALSREDVARSRVGGAEDRGDARSADETRVPLAEEELVPVKHVRTVGEVRVHKRTVVERRLVEVSVRREEVFLRRVPSLPAPGRRVSERREDAPDAFTGRTVTIPVYEEEIEIVKRPRVREELRITKIARRAERRVSGAVRREEARVERTDGSAGADPG